MLRGGNLMKEDTKMVDSCGFGGESFDFATWLRERSEEIAKWTTMLGEVMPEAMTFSTAICAMRAQDRGMTVEEIGVFERALCERLMLCMQEAYDDVCKRSFKTFILHGLEAARVGVLAGFAVVAIKTVDREIDKVLAARSNFTTN